jgi:hypothetical protein
VTYAFSTHLTSMHPKANFLSTSTPSSRVFCEVIPPQTTTALAPNISARPHCLLLRFASKCSTRVNKVVIANALYTNNSENNGQRRSAISQSSWLSRGTCSLSLSRGQAAHSARKSATGAWPATYRRALVPQLGHLPVFGQTDDLIRYFSTLAAHDNGRADV